MTRYPDPARALHQLGRHSSGTPGDVQPAPLTLTEGMALLAATFNTGSAKLLNGMQAWADSMRSKQETT